MASYVSTCACVHAHTEWCSCKPNCISFKYA